MKYNKTDVHRSKQTIGTEEDVNITEQTAAKLKMKSIYVRCQAQVNHTLTKRGASSVVT